MEHHELATLYEECKQIADEYGLRLITKDGICIERNGNTLWKFNQINDVYTFLLGYKFGTEKQENDNPVTEDCTTCAMKNPHFPWCHYHHCIIPFHSRNVCMANNPRKRPTDPR